MHFTAKELDLVIAKLLECKQPIYDFKFQEKYFNDWQLLKVKEIFKYLKENHSDMFDYFSESREYGYSIEIGDYKSIWESELKKGGFSTFWKKKEDFKTSIKKVLTGAKDSVSAINAVYELTDKLFN